MTSGQRFERDLPAALNELATAPYPSYIEDVLTITKRTHRRPAWQFPRRWLPIDFGVPLRPILIAAAVVLALLGLLVLAYVGSQRKLPEPFGLARNGVVAFTLDGQGYVGSIDGPSRPFVEGPGEEVGLTFSLDGSKIAFVRVVGKDEFLWVADSDGSNQLRLIAEPIAEPLNFDWSPDGTEMAVSYPMHGVNRIVIVKVDGSGSRVIDLGFPAADPYWRPPEGRELLFRRTDRGTGELYVMAADGSSMHSLGVIGKGLLGGAWDASGPAWSPDGSLVAYNAVEGIPDREWFRVHVVGADGTGDRALSLSAYPVSEGWPAWSPDGKKLVVQRWAGDGDARIAILGLDDQRAPASLGPRHSFVDNEAWVAIWSPDGKRLLVRWDDAADQVRDSYLLDPVTGAYTPIDWPLTDHPSWQRLAP